VISSFRDLRVWQAGMDLVEHTYRVTEEFPRHELYGLTSQLRRAAVSVPSNIAEGHTRAHTKEYLHHVSLAQASLAELQTQIEIAMRLSYCSAQQAQTLLEEAAALARQLYALRNSLSRAE
jgi:four helix bundle protein